MGNFSKDPEDRLQASLARHYVGVRLQQGVPILDADWNELEDLRRWELWSLLKWFVGDGVPENNDGFKIAPVAGGGVDTITLMSKKAYTEWSSITVNRTSSTAADALGFGPQNYTSGKIIGSAPARLTSDAAGTFPLNLSGGDKKLVIKADDLVEEEILFHSGDPLITHADNVPVSEVIAVINAQAHNVVASAGQGRDFIITGGDGTSEGAGRCLAGGWEALNEANLKYTSQALYDNDTLASKWGVAKIAPLTTPLAPRIDTVYLDVWEREVSSDEDNEHLVDARIGIETSVRVKREWAVRVREGSPDVPAVTAGHVFYRLATLVRRAGDSTITLGDIADVRERRLLLPPATLITDLLGIAPSDYRRGQGRPAISLREAVNALMRGELPSTADAPVSPGPGLNILKRGWLFDNTNGLTALWTSDRVGGTNQVFTARLDMTNPAAGFGPAQQVTTGTVHSDAHAALLPNGDLLLAYQGGLGGTADVFMRRAPQAGLSGATEQTVANTPAVAETLPFVVVSGNLAVIFYHLSSTSRWQYRRFRHTDNTWIDAGPVAIPTPGGNADAAQRQFHAALGVDGNIWLAFQQGTAPATKIGAMRLVPLTGVLDNQTVLDNAAQADEQPFVLCSASGDVWVYWNGTTALQQARFSSGAWQAIQAIPNTSGGAGGDSLPVAVEETQGGIWLFWTHCTPGIAGLPPTPPTPGDIYFMRRNPDTGGWGQPRQMTISPSDDTAPFAQIAPNNAIWIVWSSDRSGIVQPYFKRLVTAW